MKTINLVSFCIICLFTTDPKRVFAQEFASPSRTETKDDAGQQGSKSGFFQSQSPINYPSGASSWWHLLDIRHNNTANNFAMQFAGSFYDQDLYFRKTNNNASQSWRKFLTIGTDNVLNISSAVYTPQFTVRPNGQTDKANNSTWYGMGLCNLQMDGTPSDGPTVVQMAGYFGINLQTARGQFVMTRNGNIGIGTTSPSKTLSVNGTILAKEIVVKLSNSPDWPDYVFKPDYHLMDLSTLETHIRQIEHLPEMPSTEEIAQEGLDVAKTNVLLLKKIEELTLYIIDQNHRLNNQEAKINKLENKLKSTKK